MNTLIKKLIAVQKYAISIRPKVGGFPVMAEVFRQGGVLINSWYLPSCQSTYLMTEGSVVQQGEPLFTGIYQIPQFNREALITSLRADQEGSSTFAEFLKAAWDAGVTEYKVDFTKRNVSYFGVNGEIYIEEYPEVKVPQSPFLNAISKNPY